MTNKLPKLLAMATFSVAMVAVFTVLNTGSASAATINVTTDDVSPVANADGCTLREAIENINDQAATNTDCAAGDGSTDTIIIPAGTIHLQADLPQITTSIAIQGAGMGETTIDGGGAWKPISVTASSPQLVTVKDMKITGFNGYAIGGQGGSYNISQLDIDGSNAEPVNTGFGIAILNNINALSSTQLTNIYVHDFSVDTQGFQAIIVSNSSPVDMTAVLSNITVANITNTGGQINTISTTTGTLGGSGTGNISSTINNATINNITSTVAIVSGIGSIAFGNSNIVDVKINNATITDMHGVDSFIPGYSAVGLFAAGAGFDANSHTQSNVSVSNTVLSTMSPGCATLDISTYVGAPSSSQPTITSTGGNLSDDSSCATYFTQPTDQNNVAALAASLLPLADNGGFVPTMALKEGSPAIDAGITVSSLTTDARGALRPQGSAYDSGAYESPYTKPVATLANSGSNSVLVIVITTLAAMTGLLFFTRKRVYSRI